MKPRFLKALVTYPPETLVLYPVGETQFPEWTYYREQALPFETEQAAADFAALHRIYKPRVEVV